MSHWKDRLDFPAVSVEDGIGDASSPLSLIRTDLRLLEILCGFPLNTDGFRFGFLGWPKVFFGSLFSFAHMGLFLTLGIVSYVRGLEAEHQKGDGGGGGGGAEGKFSLLGILEGFTELSGTELTVFDYVLLAGVLMTIIQLTPIIEQYLTFATRRKLRKMAVKLRQLQTDFSCTSLGMEEARTSCRMFLGVTFTLNMLGASLYAPTAYKFGQTMYSDQSHWSILLVVTGYFVCGFAVYGPAAMSVDLLASFAMKAHAINVEKWMAMHALFPQYREAGASSRTMGSAGEDAASELFKIVVSRHNQQLPDKHDTEKHMEIGLRLCEINGVLSDSLGVLLVSRLGLSLVCAIICFFGGLGILLNRTYTAYSLSWAAGLIIFGAVYVNVMWFLGRTGHDLESAKSKAASAIECYRGKLAAAGVDLDPDAVFTMSVLRDRFRRAQSVGSYGGLDRYGFVAFLAALFSYLIVLIQFKQAM